MARHRPAPAPRRMRLTLRRHAAAPAAPAGTSGGRIFASPLARRIAADKGIDLAQVKGTGPKGRIVKADVEGFTPAARRLRPAAAAPAAAPAACHARPGRATDRSPEDVPGPPSTTSHAGRYAQDHRGTPDRGQADRSRISICAGISNWMRCWPCARRSTPRARSPASSSSVNDFIIKACAAALQRVPGGECRLGRRPGAAAEGLGRRRRRGHRGRAVHPGDPGRPRQGAWRSSPSEMKDLAGRARDRKLAPHEYQGGSASRFPISACSASTISMRSSIRRMPRSWQSAPGCKNRSSKAAR